MAVDNGNAFALTNSWCEDSTFRKALDREMGGRWKTIFRDNHWFVIEVRGDRVLDSYESGFQPHLHGPNPDLNCSLYSMYLLFAAVDGNLREFVPWQRGGQAYNLRLLRDFCNVVIDDPRFMSAARVWSRKGWNARMLKQQWRIDVGNWWAYWQSVLSRRR